MDRTRLRNTFLKSWSVEFRIAYNKQRSYWVSLIQKIKRESYNNLDHEKNIDNKSFQKYVKPLFTDKNPRSNKITLVEKDSILDKYQADIRLNIKLIRQYQTQYQTYKIAETFNNFFTSSVSNLNTVFHGI